jgi:hypothetical protein
MARIMHIKPHIIAAIDKFLAHLELDLAPSKSPSRLLEPTLKAIQQIPLEVCTIYSIIDRN